MPPCHVLLGGKEEPWQVAVVSCKHYGKKAGLRIVRTLDVIELSHCHFFFNVGGACQAECEGMRVPEK